MPKPSTAAPWHLWWVGGLTFLWNSIGCFDYLATQFRYEPYMSQFNPDQLEFFYDFPAWLVAFWAIAVWGSLAGSVGLLLRRVWALWAFTTALLAMMVTSFHNFVLEEGVQIMGEAGAVFTAVIFLVAVALVVYARWIKKRLILS
ncbi:MAG: hypothetical protein ACO200_11525 [Steroidobacteraceae bacterium]